MSTGKRLVPVVVSAAAAGLLLALMHVERPATAQSAGNVWGFTAIGAALALPPDFDRSRIAGDPEYSPSGEYLAFETSDGGLSVLDIKNSRLRDVYDVVAVDKPNLSCQGFAWLAEDTLWVRESWITNTERANWEPRLPMKIGHARYRVIDWKGGAVLEEKDADAANRLPFAVAGAADHDQWIVWAGTALADEQQPWIYDARSELLVRPAVECGDGGFLFSRSGQWYLKLLCPPPSTGHNPWLGIADAELINTVTGERKVVRDLPPRPPRGPCVTADGRYIITSTFIEDESRHAPLVIDTKNSQQYYLPNTESWVAVDINNERAVVLAMLNTRRPDGDWDTEYAEIPLCELLPQ